MYTEIITVAFIKVDGTFVPKHVSEIKKKNIYYLVIDGKTPAATFKALGDAFQNENGQWTVNGKEIPVRKS
ncbi:MAG: hypothetical protein EOO52_13425 [Gammaproteobacteria bacterium]|nr:MAG: hypothetical protein EOO52_13425 [Gammaproteobacteria bacterium]